MPKGTNTAAGEMPVGGAGSGMQTEAVGVDNGEGALTGDQSNEQAPASFESWLGAQDAAVKALYAEHTKGLKGALETERAQRNDLTKQLKELGSRLGKGTTEREEIERLQAQVEATSRERDFIDEAIGPEINCIRPKLAYLLADKEKLWDRYGNPDWKRIREEAPELFRPTGRAGSADGGAGQGQRRTTDMNTLIRRAAGIG